MRNYIKKIYLLGILFTFLVGLSTFMSHRYLESHFHEEVQRNIDFPLNSILKQVKFDLEKAGDALTMSKIYMSFERDDDNALKYFRELLQQNDSFFSVYFGTPDNDFICASRLVIPKNNTDIRKSVWYREAVRKEKLILTEPYLNDAEDKFVFTMAQPVYDDGGALLGVVGIDKSLQGMLELLKNEKASENGYSFTLNRERDITMCPSCEYEVGVYKNIVNVSNIKDKEVWNEPEGLTFVTLHGRETGYLKWQTIEELGLVLATFAPIDDFISKRILNIQLFSVTFMSFVIILLFLFLFLKKYIIHPMKKLDDDIMAISMDDRDYRLPLSEKHFFVSLRQTINRNLEKTQDYFENVIKQREELGVAYKQLQENEKELQEQYDEIKGHRSHIQYLADHDPLTGLFNRRKFSENLCRSLERNENGAIFMLDIDNFKNFNDIQGHVYGDKILKLVAKVLEDSLEPYATAYRFGGDEFLILVEGLEEQGELGVLVKIILDKLYKARVADGGNIHLTASLGIVRYPLDGHSPDELLSKADIALHNAKNSSKSSFLFFETNMASTFSQRVHIEQILHETMQTKKFKLLYQPIIDAKTGKIAYLEALIRIQNISISPAVFIPIAEESNLIIPIGRWVIKEAIKQLIDWRQRGRTLRPIAINFSPKQFYDTGLADYLARILREEGVDPNLIEVEITESVFIDNIEEVVKIVKRIRSLGIKVSLDDFGTGYSSINYITRIPVNRIKLDRRLTEKLSENMSVLEGLIAMAHGLRMEVVGEGVERVEEAKFLRKVGCNFLQGYLFSVPIPPEEVEEVINVSFGKLLEMKEDS